MTRRHPGAQPFEVTRRDTLREWLEERLAPLPEFETRRLFSGAGLYSGDTIFGIYGFGRIYLKVDDDTRPDFIAKGSERFCPPSGRTLGRYYEVPPDILDDDDEFSNWCRRAIQAASTPAPPRKSAKRHVRLRRGPK